MVPGESLNGFFLVSKKNEKWYLFNHDVCLDFILFLSVYDFDRKKLYGYYDNIDRKLCLIVI